jgi:hypothetical protein
LILGENYGSSQPSGISATHEEYREARGKKPVIAFVQAGVTRETQEDDFVTEVQGWEGGLFRGSFTGAGDLKIGLTRALHDYDLSRAVGPVDQNDLLKRALEGLPTDRRNFSSGSVSLNLSVAGAPRQSILRPIELEKPSLADALHQAALFGPNALFDKSLGVEREIDNETLMLSQERGRAAISVNEEGSILIAVPARETSRMLPELIQERVQAQFSNALAYASWLIDLIDPTQRTSHVAIAASITNGEHMGWRTQRESDDNRNQISLGSAAGMQRKPVHVIRTRPSMRLDAARVIEDLIVPLRRQWK